MLGAVFGEIWMLLRYVYAEANVSEPIAVDIDSATLPVACGGVTAVNVLASTGVIEVNARPPSVAVIEPAVVGKFAPVTVIVL